MEETLAGGRKPAGRGGRRGGNPVRGHKPAEAGEHCGGDPAMSTDGCRPGLSGIAVPSVTAPAPRRGATKAKAKGKKLNYNTFESVERWIWGYRKWG